MKAGFGRSDLTPRLGVQLSGYGPYRNRAGTAILAPLYARAVALVSGRDRAVVISAELIGFERGLDLRIRQVVAARIKLKPDQVFLAPTHTHSAPAVGGLFGWGEADRVYVETLPARIADAAEAAWNARADVTWTVGDTSLEGFAVNREVDEGYAAKADFKSRLEASWRPDMPEMTDPTVRVIAAYARSGACLGVIHQFACHPVVCGEQTHDIHGDYVGLACAGWEKAHPQAVCLYLGGAFGDINPCLNHRNPAESRRAIRILGKRYQASIAQALRAAKPMVDQESLRIVRFDVQFARQARSQASVRAEIRVIERGLTVRGLDDRPAAGTPPLSTRGMVVAKLTGLRVIASGYKGGRAPNPAVALVGLRLGSLSILGCGLEVFHTVGQEILRGLGGAPAWVVSLVGGMGYAADARGRKLGGYAQTFIPYVLGEIPFKSIDRDLPAAMVRLQLKLR